MNNGIIKRARECPFCGSEVISYMTSRGAVWIGCFHLNGNKACLASIGPKISKAEALKLWNKRASDREEQGYRRQPCRHCGTETCFRGHSRGGRLMKSCRLD